MEMVPPGPLGWGEEALLGTAGVTWFMQRLQGKICRKCFFTSVTYKGAQPTGVRMSTFG